jgi:hypothetical protein
MPASARVKPGTLRESSAPPQKGEAQADCGQHGYKKCARKPAQGSHGPDDHHSDTENGSQEYCRGSDETSRGRRWHREDKESADGKSGKSQYQGIYEHHFHAQHLWQQRAMKS